MRLENKEKVREVISTHLQAIDILKVADHSLEEKAKRIHAELPAIYKKLKEEKLLPEEMDFQRFMNTGGTMLQMAYNDAALASAFGFF